MTTLRGWPQEADLLKRRFEEVFWSERLSTFVLALDREKKRCEVRTSNAGHSLYSGIASQEHGKRIAQTLMGQGSFTGWGIRTVDASEARYNPMSYHNGSVWPHDNSLIASGLSSYGLKDAVINLVTGFFEASNFVDLQRLPELFCGFHRRAGEGPTLYPVACTPQAWAAAAPFMFLQALLGLSITCVPKKRVSFFQPVLPPFLSSVAIQSLRVGESSMDLLVVRQAEGVKVQVLHGAGDVEVLTTA